jgi:hypothetical protein
VTTSDARAEHQPDVIDPETAHHLDGILLEAFSFAPTPEVRATLDRRVTAVIASATREPGGRRNALPRLRNAKPRVRRVAILVAAALVVGGAGRGLLGLYEGMVGSDGWRTAWDRGAVVNTSQTLHGYRVTIERVYADLNQLMVGVTVQDVQDRGWTQVSATSVRVKDEQGREFEEQMAMSSPEGSTVAANLVFLAPPVGLAPGPHKLQISVGSVEVRDNSTPPPEESAGTATRADNWNPWHDVEGPWTFTVSVEVVGGSVARPNNTAIVAGTEVRLSQVIVSPSSITATISVVSSSKAGDWAPIGQFEHAGRVYQLGGTVSLGGDDATTLQATDGTANASGDWTLRITELVGSNAKGQVRLAGPWLLKFSMP